MDRRTPVLAAVAAALAFAPWTLPSARADRLAGNYRGPDDRYLLREEAPATEHSRADRNPLLAAFHLDRPFHAGVEAGRREAAFRGRPLLVLFVLPGCERSAAAVEGAFRDAAVLDLAARFVPVVADAEKEESFGVAHGVRSVPTLLLLDRAGRETGRAEGTVEAAEAATLLREALRKAGPARPSAEARALEKAASSLVRARQAGDWRATLDAAAAIEAIGHDGPELDAARAARGEAAREAGARLDAATRRIRVGGMDDAHRTLARIERDFAGLEEADAAADLRRGLSGTRRATLSVGSRLDGAVGPGTGVTTPRLPKADLPSLTGKDVLTDVRVAPPPPPPPPEDPPPPDP